MSDLILPQSCKPNRKSVQISDIRVCVLIHKDTNRILCFAQDDPSTHKIARRIGLKVIEIFHAHEYDKYAKIWRDQAKNDSEAEDYAYLERENEKRKKLRAELRSRLNVVTTPAERITIESALKCLDSMEARRQRKREESFLAQEAYESNTNVGEELINKLMVPKKKVQ